METTINTTDWRVKSACRDVDPEIFFAPDGEHEGINRTRREQRAKNVCWECPVSGNCLNWALERNEMGIWGGMTEGERKSVKRRGSRARCVRCGSMSKAAIEGGQVCVYCGLSWLV
jgi:WhiB family transcriptional regulator, redox-sensing transcriptional regulator